MTTERAVDQETLYRMRDIIRKRLDVDHLPVEVAAAEARGFDTARHPNAAAEIEAALLEMLRDIGALPPEVLPQETAGAHLTTAATTDLAASIAYVLQFDERGRRRKSSWDFAASMAGMELARRLEATGYVLMRTAIKIEPETYVTRKAWEPPRGL